MKKVIPAMLAVGMFSLSAQAMLLDNMNNISGTQWIDTRNEGLISQSSFGHDGGGSMKIAYDNAGIIWDVVPQRYFHAANGPVSPAPYNNQLNLLDPTSDTITMWVYADENAGKARINEIILYSYATGSPARFHPPLFTNPGWNQIVAPRTAFVVDGGDPLFLWSGIQTFQIWATTWDTRGTSPIYIDDINLVPEPMTMSLLGLGGLALLRRRR